MRKAFSSPKQTHTPFPIMALRTSRLATIQLRPIASLIKYVENRGKILKKLRAVLSGHQGKHLGTLNAESKPKVRVAMKDLITNLDGRVGPPLLLWFLGVPGGLVLVLWLFFFRG